MDIKAEKLNLISWLAGIEDGKIIRQFKILQKLNEELSELNLSKAEKAAIDEALDSVKKGKVQSHEQVMKTTAKKYPNLFK